MSTSRQDGRSGWTLVVPSFATNLIALYAPYLRLVFSSSHDVPPEWLPIVPGIHMADWFFNSIRLPSSEFGATVVMGLFTLTILLAATAVGSINRGALVAAATALAGHAIYSVWFSGVWPGV